MTTFFILAFLLLGANKAVAQSSSARISNVNFELVSENLIITYDILKAKPQERFYVWIEIYTAMENRIKAKTISGDVDSNVTGGERKKAVWDIQKDSIFLDNDIYAMVSANPYFISGSDKISKVETPKSDVSTEVSGKTKTISAGKYLMLSSLYPGLGDYRMEPQKKYFWAAGAVAYGSIALSVLYNRSSYTTFQNYRAGTDAATRDDLYNEALLKKRLSTGFIAASAAIWVADLAWVYVKARKLKKNHPR